MPCTTKQLGVVQEPSQLATYCAIYSEEHPSTVPTHNNTAFVGE